MDTRTGEVREVTIEEFEQLKREADGKYWKEASPLAKARPSTGRNEPCPCGSGKKFKECCLTVE